MNENDDLRQLFEDATSQIRPQGTLDDIRNRTEKVDPMTRRWFLPSLAAAAVMVALIGGAFYFTRDAGGSTAGTVGPAGSPSDEPTKVTVTLTNSVIYYVGDGARGPRLFSETHKVASTDYAPPVAAVNKAMTGNPDDADYRSYWPEGVTADRVTNQGEVIGIRLVGDGATDRPSGVTAAQAKAQVEAIVRTAEAAMNADQSAVEFYVGDTRLDSVLGVRGTVAGPHSLPANSASFYPGNDEDVLALVSISTPTNNEKLAPGKLTVSGMASAFEANITWEILVGGDAVIDSGNATAAAGQMLSPYTFQTNIALQPGTYTVVVHDTDESGAGRPVNRDSKEIIVE